jgi:nitrogen fixation NifU-like protein
MRYSEETIRYYNNLKNVGSLDETVPQVGTGVVGSPLCGDVMKLQIMFDSEDIITDVKYKVFGCVSAIASMELICDLLKGLSVQKALQISNEDVAKTLRLSEIKTHCSVLGKEAIEAAVTDYLNKKKGGHKMVTVSDQALGRLRDLVGKHDPSCLGVEIVVSNGGCSGIEYSLRYISETSTDHSSIDVEDVRFFYRKDDEPLIEGVDVSISPNSIGHGFVVINKNQLSCKNCTCKCR